jgi:molecular chaperone GrpE
MNASSPPSSKPHGPWKVRNFSLWNHRKRKQKEKAVDTDNPQAENPQTDPVEALPEESPVDFEARLAAEREQFAAEKAELTERLLRARAEFENARRRNERDRMEYLQYASMDLVRDILPILDDFERALKVETADRDYAKGVELIYQRMADTLKKVGLEPIETAGQLFDPNLHQAVERVPTEEAEDQAILGEFQRGYNFKGKLLRPAMVRVAVRP